VTNAVTATPGGIATPRCAVMPGSNYSAAAGTTLEDIVVTGAAGTSADLQMTKSGPSAAEVGAAVQYIAVASPTPAPSSVAGSISISDLVPGLASAQ
jgi:hypothetical protein